jgi:hypothetical protein
MKHSILSIFIWFQIFSTSVNGAKLNLIYQSVPQSLKTLVTPDHSKVFDLETHADWGYQSLFRYDVVTKKRDEAVVSNVDLPKYTRPFFRGFSVFRSHSFPAITPDSRYLIHQFERDDVYVLGIIPTAIDEFSFRKFKFEDAGIFAGFLNESNQFVSFQKNNIELWTIENGALKKIETRSLGERVFGVQPFSNRTKLMVVTKDELHVLEAETLKTLWKMKHEFDEPSTEIGENIKAAINSDQIAFRVWDAWKGVQLRIFDGKTGTLTLQKLYEGAGHPQRNFDLSADGQYLFQTLTCGKNSKAAICNQNVSDGDSYDQTVLERISDSKILWKETLTGFHETSCIKYAFNSKNLEIASYLEHGSGDWAKICRPMRENNIHLHDPLNAGQVEYFEISDRFNWRNLEFEHDMLILRDFIGEGSNTIRSYEIVR